MSCCAPGVEVPLVGTRPHPLSEEVIIASRDVGDGLMETVLSVPGVHCAACIRTVEAALTALPQVVRARVNLSSRRVHVFWRRTAAGMPALTHAIEGAGYDSFLADPVADPRDPELGRLLRALAVAGFASGNIMMLSVSVWSGADEATRLLLHVVSALICVPAVLYSGQVFFRSAWNVLKRGRTNMDVPISVGILLTFGLSVVETLHNSEHAYFDAAASLVFFLLIGRTLDHLMRARARGAVTGLERLMPLSATVVGPDGSRDTVPAANLSPGMHIVVASGERFPVDARLLGDGTLVDASLATGEVAPVAAVAGDDLQAGTMNLGGTVLVEASSSTRDSFLARMIDLMTAAEAGRAEYRRLIDRASALYTPCVHLAAIAALAGWGITTGDWYRATVVAVSVLIITCPCALGLAVPMVQVVAARRLFEAGIAMRDGAGLERLADVDTVILDKTGTLTEPTVSLFATTMEPDRAMRLAASLAQHSRHPVSRAIATGASRRGERVAFDTFEEMPGDGVRARSGTDEYRLGRADWALRENAEGLSSHIDGPVLSLDGRLLAAFNIDERLRPGAREALSVLRSMNLAVEIASGDADARVARVAGLLDVEDFLAAVRPEEKLRRIERLQAAGRRVLMVGDGLNDTAALAAAQASVAPASAADVGRNAADFVFLRNDLRAVPQAIGIARASDRLVRQNLWFAVAYNAAAVSLAVSGMLTPLIAALCMSASSIAVTLNALRLRAPSTRPIAGPRPGGVVQMTQDARHGAAGVVAA